MQRISFKPSLSAVQRLGMCYGIQQGITMLSGAKSQVALNNIVKNNPHPGKLL